MTGREHCAQCGDEGELYHFRGGTVCGECIKEAVELEQEERKRDHEALRKCIACGHDAVVTLGDLRLCAECIGSVVEHVKAVYARDRAIVQDADNAPPLEEVSGVYICTLCLDGKGGECHTTGCLFWMCSAPDVPLRDRIADFGGSILRPEGSHAPKPTVIRELPQEEWEKAAVRASERWADNEGEA